MLEVTRTPPILSHEDVQHRAAYGDGDVCGRATPPTDKGVNPKDQIGATKTPLGLLPWTGLIRVARVMALGARKYGPYNWRTKGQAVQHMTYCEAALRHLAAYIDGQSIDPESGENHLAHVAACALIVLDAEACGNSVDNRPVPGVAAELMALPTTR